MMFRLTKPYGTPGLASYAISAVDLALWDLKGKLLGQPVYKLLGGAHKERIRCYATGNDVDWYLELGFTAFKLACPYGPADGLDGIRKNEEFVAQARARIGEQADLMLDCWMAFDVEYTVRLAETLRPYRLRWIEECLIPEDLDAHVALRQRLPWQSLATGEHWYTAVPFQWAIRHQVADILQPDIHWCGGMSVCRKIGAMAEAGGVSVMLHGGGNTAPASTFPSPPPPCPGASTLWAPPRACRWTRPRACRASRCRWTAGWPPATPPALAWTCRSPGSSRSSDEAGWICDMTRLLNTDSHRFYRFFVRVDLRNLCASSGSLIPDSW